jgi:hypothetical protein
MPAPDALPEAESPAPADPRPDDGLNRASQQVAYALRGARARTGMSEQQVVAVLARQGFTITAARLRGWERTGVLRVDVAARLADVYGITIDSLAGRRAYRSRRISEDLADLRPAS